MTPKVLRLSHCQALNTPHHPLLYSWCINRITSVTEALWNFRARRNLSEHWLQSPWLTSDKLRPRDLKELLPDPVTPHHLSITYGFGFWYFVLFCFVFSKVNFIPMLYFSSQVYNIHKLSLLHLPDQYLWLSNPLDRPESQVNGEKAPWWCGIFAFLNGDQSVIKYRATIIRPLQGSDPCHLEGAGWDFCFKLAQPRRLWKWSISY